MNDNENNEGDNSRATFFVTVGKSYKNRGWAVKRSYLYSLIPQLPYEKQCIVFIEDFKVPASLNIHTRFFYFKNEELSNYLKVLSNIDTKSQVQIEFDLEHGIYSFKKPEKDLISFTTKFSKSFKNGMFAMPRNLSKELLPILPYENKCKFYIGNLESLGKFNIEFRIKFNSKYVIEKIGSSKKEGDELNISLLIE